MTGEELQMGWEKLAAYLRVSQRKIMMLRPELLACGAIFLYERRQAAQAKALLLADRDPEVDKAEGLQGCERKKGLDQKRHRGA